MLLVLRGRVTVTVDSDSAVLGEGQCLVTGPAIVSMRSKDGARLVGFQIAAGADQPL
jgi:hypothetical protein